jgi:hypothetical protein
MDNAANKITKRYDEQAAALDRVNKINQRIIAQQKQQIGLSSALVEGDIAAAAAAVQDIRAANASEAGQSQADMLDVAKQAEVDALRSASGMSRVEIEQRQFDISQEIYDLEEKREIKLEAIRVIEDKIYKVQETQIKPLEKQLKTNEDMVQAIEDQRDAEIEAIDAQRQKWTDAALALDLAEVKGGKFNDVIDMAKKLTGDVVADWESLEDQTRILTIETVLKGLGGPATDDAIVQESGTGGGGGGNIPEQTEVDETAVTEEEAKGPLETAFAWLEDQGGSFADWWNTLFGDIGKWLSEQWTAFTTWLSTLPGKIATFGANLWAGIQGIPAWLGEQWTSFQTWLGEVPAKIVQAAGYWWEALMEIGPWLDEQWTIVSTWFTEELLPGIGEWGANLWEGIQNIGAWLGVQWDNFVSWMGSLVEGVAQWGADVWEGMQGIPEWLETQWRNFSTWFTDELIPGIANWGVSVWEGMQGIPEWLAVQFQNFMDWVMDLPGEIANWARDLWNNGLPTFGQWLIDRGTELRNWFRDLPNKIANWAGNLFGGLGTWLSDNFNTGRQQRRDENATGGMIYRNRGGDVPGEGNLDTVPAMLTPGEYVVNKRSTAKYRPALKAMNAGTFGGGMAANRYKIQPPQYSPSSFSKDIASSRYSVQPPTYSPSDLSESVYNVPSRGQEAAGSNLAMFSPQSTTATQFDNPVYNYSLSVNVNGSNASANDIASTVMERIKRVDSQRLRKQVIR